VGGLLATAAGDGHRPTPLPPPGLITNHVARPVCRTPPPSPLPEAERGSRRGTSGVALPAPRGRRALLSFSPSPPRGGGWGEGFWKLSAPGDEQDIDSLIALQRGLVARPERVPGDGPIVGRLDKHVRVAGPPYLQLIGVQNQRCRALDGQAKQ